MQRLELQNTFFFVFPYMSLTQVFFKDAVTCAKATAPSRIVSVSSSGQRGGACRRTYAFGRTRARASAALRPPVSCTAASRASTSASRTAAASYPCACSFEASLQWT